MIKPRVQHIRKPRFVDPTKNNIVERLKGTVSEKVMRGIKDDTTTEELVQGFLTYYNKTPHEPRRTDTGRNFGYKS